ncbi:MAG: hypothetical protein ACRDKB_02530 [Actinomycetota bacterium]
MVADSLPTYRIVREDDEKSLYVVYREGECVLRATSLSGVLDWLLWDVHGQAMVGSREFLILHAGAVSWDDRGIVLPAPPDSGKTTLTAGLTRAGLSYLTDEAALIDPVTARMHPYPRALWFEPPTLELFPEVRNSLPPACRVDGRSHYQVCPDDLRPGSVGGPCQIRYVIAPHYAKGSSTFLEPISRAAGVHALAKNAFNFDDFSAGGLSVLAEIVRGADCYRLSIGNLSEAVALIKDLARSDN